MSSSPRIRLRLAKRGRARYLSHHDLARTLERSLRRARVPLALTQGFHPHPRISFGGALALGCESEAEYLEIVLSEPMEPGQLVADLNATFPEGLEILEAAEVPGESPKLGSLLQGSVFEVVVEVSRGADAIESGVVALLAKDSFKVERSRPGGASTQEIRSAILSLNVWRDESGYVTLRAELRHLTPAVRPDDVLLAIGQLTGCPLEVRLIRRIAQGPVTASGVVSLPVAQGS
ncbi:MAG: TIGR03936 family radical SAM-associated protein [Actinomycetota bacterium]